MFHVLDPDQYSPAMLALTILGVVSAGLVAGYVTDLVMAERGFGFFGNGLLTILGGGTGIYTRYAFFGWVHGEEMMVVGIFALSMATLMLLLLGLAKHWVVD